MTKPRRIVYLINPISGTKGKEKTKLLIEQATKANSIFYEILPTNAAGNYDALKEKIAKENITDVVICGGDGTVNSVTNALQKVEVHIGIVPMGSGNGLALAAGISKDPQKALDIIFKGHAEHVDSFLINGQYSCMLSGIGFDAKVAHEFAKQKTRGLATYVQETIKQYFKSRPHQFEIRVDGFTFFTDAYFISVANANQFGNQFTIAPQASLNDGLLDIVVVQKMNKARLPFAIYKHIKGNTKLQQLVSDMQHQPIFYFQTTHLQIINHQLAPLHIDGEPRDTAKTFDIEIVPNTYKLLMPKK
jgi:diacylglycerol kinase (ATP)